MPEYTTRSIDDYQHLARLSSTYITELFGSKQYPPPSPLSQWQDDLPLYIACALAQAQLERPALFGALVLLKRYKMRLPQNVSYGRSAYRLFISSYMVATKLMYDKGRPMATWRAIAQNIFSVQELTVMELEFCRVLDWNLQMDEKHLALLQITCDITEPIERYSDVPHVRFSNSKDTAPPRHSFVSWDCEADIPLPTGYCDGSPTRIFRAPWKRINLRKKINTLFI